MQRYLNASLLPISTDAPEQVDNDTTYRTSKTPLTQYFKRLSSFQLDFEMAVWTMLYLLISPARVYLLKI